MHFLNLNLIIVLLFRCFRSRILNKLSNFEEPLHKDNSVSIHHNNIHALAIEMYKVVNGRSPEIMKFSNKEAIPIII